MSDSSASPQIEVSLEGFDWDFTSRELTFYLDPETQDILHQWHNP